MSSQRESNGNEKKKKRRIKEERESWSNFVTGPYSILVVASSCQGTQQTIRKHGQRFDSLSVMMWRIFSGFFSHKCHGKITFDQSFLLCFLCFLFFLLLLLLPHHFCLSGVSTRLHDARGKYRACKGSISISGKETKKV